MIVVGTPEECEVARRLFASAVHRLGTDAPDVLRTVEFAAEDEDVHVRAPAPVPLRVPLFTTVMMQLTVTLPRNPLAAPPAAVPPQNKHTRMVILASTYINNLFT